MRRIVMLGSLLSLLLQVNVVGMSSPEFDAAFANEAEAMFTLRQAESGQASSIDQLQRRLRLSDIGLQPSTAAQALLEDSNTIKV